MNSPMKSPLHGHPATWQTTDEAGLLSFKVTPCELTPLRARLADGVSAVAGLGLMAASAMIFIDWRYPDLPSIAVTLGATALGYHLLRWITREACRVTTEINLGMEEIRVRHLLGWQRYDRRLAHRFLLLPHDGGERERRRNELATREASASGQVVQKPIYYGDSFHVVLEYAGHRVDVLSVYGRKQAEAILARLQYCDQLLDEEAKRNGGGATPRPGEGWFNQPGGL